MYQYDLRIVFLIIQYQKASRRSWSKAMSNYFQATFQSTSRVIKGAPHARERHSLSQDNLRYYSAFPGVM
jgi:hypothetical protein